VPGRRRNTRISAADYQRRLQRRQWAEESPDGADLASAAEQRPQPGITRRSLVALAVLRRDPFAPRERITRVGIEPHGLGEVKNRRRTATAFTSIFVGLIAPCFSAAVRRCSSSASVIVAPPGVVAGV
jgi:hypothetical protein